MFHYICPSRSHGPRLQFHVVSWGSDTFSEPIAYFQEVMRSGQAHSFPTTTGLSGLCGVWGLSSSIPVAKGRGRKLPQRQSWKESWGRPNPSLNSKSHSLR